MLQQCDSRCAGARDVALWWHLNHGRTLLPRETRRIERGRHRDLAKLSGGREGRLSTQSGRSQAGNGGSASPIRGGGTYGQCSTPPAPGWLDLVPQSVPRISIPDFVEPAVLGSQWIEVPARGVEEVVRDQPDFIPEL